jgi:KipI family sensor histidine kinase inhibitor
MNWRIVEMGEAAWLIENDLAGEAANRYALALAAAIEQQIQTGLIAVVPAINSVLLQFDPLLVEAEELREQVEQIVPGLKSVSAAPARIIEIGVVYGGTAGPDLTEVAATAGLSEAEVVALHSNQTYRVLMIGFAPGFPYLGPLPKQLQLPRRKTPRTAVPAGSVAIAAGMSGIYPARLPGGWHLLGSTEQRMFTPERTQPALLAPGDGVQFVPLPEGVQP